MYRLRLFGRLAWLAVVEHFVQGLSPELFFLNDAKTIRFIMLATSSGRMRAADCTQIMTGNASFFKIGLPRNLAVRVVLV